MNLSQRCQYGLRGMFELARRGGRTPVNVGEIAEAQAIPPRFLELILGQLRQAGYVESRRGVHGGYILVGSAAELTVGEIIRFFEGPLAPVKCIAGQGGGDCPLLGRCAFLGLWQKAQDVVEQVYDTTTFQDLVDEDNAATAGRVLNYCI